MHLTCGDGSTWRVQTLEHWCADLIVKLDDCEPVYPVDEVVFHDTRSTLGVMAGWIGNADYLALRMPRMPWLVASQTKQEPS